MGQGASPQWVEKATRELVKGEVVEERPEKVGLVPVFRWEA